MPEVPEQIHSGIAQLELEANDAKIQVPPSSVAIHNGPSSSTYNHYEIQQPHNSSVMAPTNRAPSQSSILHNQGSSKVPQSQSNELHHHSHVTNVPDQPNFTPFPRLLNRPKNVPPSDDEKAALLEEAQLKVLNSNDPEMQLAWAQDALAYVDAAMLYEQRIYEFQPTRPATPQVEHQMRVDAMNIVTFLADQHHPRGEFIRGMWLEFGKFGQRMDKREAFRCYTRAAEKGYARAEYRMGMLFEQANDPAKALLHYKRGAEAGDSAANYRLGMMTLLGQNGQPQDYNRGLQLLRQSAQTADENAPQGAYVLGMLQIRELPQISIPEIYLPYNEDTARENIEKAAYLGFARSQLKMGSAYELCSLGCEFNPVLSIHYNALAARQGEAEAEMALSKWFLCGYEGIFQKNDELAYVHARRAAQAGLATAMFALGYYNEIGVCVPANLDKALEWYEKAAKAGNQDAVGRIEGLKSRALTRKDHENVAISRIRSQYGSLRSGRQDRLRTPAKSLPSIDDTSLESPGSSNDHVPNLYSLGTPVGLSTTSRTPNRNSTMTPYPIDDRPPTVPPAVDRPATVTPYPLTDGPPEPAAGSGSAAVFFRPELHASTSMPNNVHRIPGAFNIKPEIISGHAGPGSSPLGPRASTFQTSGVSPPRPYTTINETNGGRERPLSAQRVASGGFATPGYRQPGGPSVEHPESGPIAKVDKPEPPRLDIGFSAPLDDRRNRLQRVGPPASPRTQQPKIPDKGPFTPLQSMLPHVAQRSNSGATKPPLNERYASLNERYASPSPLAAKDSHTPQARPYDRPTIAQPGAARPDSRPNSRPSSRQTSRPGSSTGRPMKQDQVPEPPLKLAPSAVPKPTPAAGAAASRPPGKGPQTFEDMGIPQHTKESDCVGLALRTASAVISTLTMS